MTEINKLKCDVSKEINQKIRALKLEIVSNPRLSDKDVIMLDNLITDLVNTIMENE